jgi:hypothetical protein
MPVIEWLEGGRRVLIAVVKPSADMPCKKAAPGFVARSHSSTGFVAPIRRAGPGCISTAHRGDAAAAPPVAETVRAVATVKAPPSSSRHACMHAWPFHVDVSRR